LTLSGKQHRNVDLCGGCMKSSELINKLEEIMEYDGDVVVKVMDCNKEWQPIGTVWLRIGMKDKYICVM